jgi:type I restriction enzyme S subunit
MRIGEALDEVDQPIQMRDSETYDLVSIRRRNGGMFRRESLTGRDILTKTLRSVTPGTFVIARMQIVHGASALATNDFAGCAISKSYSSFKGTTRCDASYFSWLAKLPFMYAYFLDSSQGVVIEKMTFDQQRWLSLPVCLPPISEQRQIVEILETVQSAIQSAEKFIDKLEKVKQGLLFDLLTRGISDGTLRDPTRHPGDFLDTKIGRMHRSWKIVELGEVADVHNGTTPSRVRPDYWSEGTIPWLASGKVNDYRINSPSELITRRAVEETSLRLLPAGAIVIGMIGEGRTRGMSARLEIDATINQNLAGIIPGPDLDAVYCHVFLHANYAILRNGGRGSNQDALNTSLVAKFPIALPPLEEQRSIAEVVRHAELQLDQEALELAKLQRSRRE